MLGWLSRPARILASTTRCVLLDGYDAQPRGAYEASFMPHTPTDPHIELLCMYPKRPRDTRNGVNFDYMSSANDDWLCEMKVLITKQLARHVPGSRNKTTKTNTSAKQTPPDTKHTRRKELLSGGPGLRNPALLLWAPRLPLLRSTRVPRKAGAVCSMVMPDEDTSLLSYSNQHRQLTSFWGITHPRPSVELMALVSHRLI
jgi:hypothetical protein